MANPIWVTGNNAKLINLGTVTEGIYFQYLLDSYDPTGGPVTYKFLAGTLPSGIRVNSSGYIQGAPVLTDVANETRSFEFSVRASDQNGLVSDKSFTITIANINPPVIVPRITNLGQVFDGQFYSLQLEATELNPYAVLTWSLSSGRLPLGLTLSSSGLISGFIMPLVTYGNSGKFGFNADPYNEYAYENAPSYQDNNYQFTISVFDGVNYDSLTYQLYVVAKENYTADTTFDLVNDTYLTIDHDNSYVPIITTPSQNLPEVRSNSKFAFKIDAVDPNDVLFSFSLVTSGAAAYDEQGYDVVAYDQENLSVPPGLLLDSSTGWLAGTIGSQVAAVQQYNFQVYAYENSNPTRASTPIAYTMTVLGDITNNISWTTGANLGIIDNGSISELSVSAVNHSGKSLVYSLVSDSSSLPQGLEVQSSGLVVGRASFEFFSLDHGTTTVDGTVSGFDNTYTFTVQATTTDGTASSQQSFTVLVNNYNLTPYENIYLTALPTVDQRNTFLSIVDNNDIFPESLIYRPTDPNFGRARGIRSLFLSGLAPTAVSSYLNAISTNTYNKRIDFSNIKTAQAVDANFNVKYEVVYLELEDSASYKGKSPANSYHDSIIGKTIYPNSFDNMASVITGTTGYAKIGAMPDWMTSPQANKKVLGFTRAIVLAYTVPGASSLIAYRLQANGITFNNINFVADRYDLDNVLTINYNLTTSSYNLGKETTFDRIIRQGAVATSVTYGIAGKAFNAINNQTVATIQANGGLDGITDFSAGDTVIFVQQENFGSAAGAYDGWTNNGSVIPGYNEFVNSTKISSGDARFPSSPALGQTAVVNNVYYQFVADYDSNGNLLDTVWKVANLRANPWQINIANGVVTLTPVIFSRNTGTGLNIVTEINSTISIGDRVQVNRGRNYSENIIFYDSTLKAGNSVPAYTVVPTPLANSNNTTRFDNYGTRFINDRDTYLDPEVGDTWLKFPETGPLLT